MRHDKTAGLLHAARALATSAEGPTLDEMAAFSGDEGRAAGRRTAERVRDALQTLVPQATPASRDRHWPFPATSIGGCYTAPRKAAAINAPRSMHQMDLIIFISEPNVRPRRRHMERVDLSQAIVKYGTEAVLRYRTVSGIKQDRFLPEIFLGSFIACGIHDEMKLHARTEVLYTDIASEHGVELSADLVRVIGGYRADIAVYQEGIPVAVVELKIFNDGKTASSVLADRDKMAKLSKLCRVETYMGALVTDIESGVLCTTRAHRLGEVLEQESQIVGEPQLSGDGNWKWCFVSGLIQNGSNPNL